MSGMRLSLYSHQFAFPRWLLSWIYTVGGRCRGRSRLREKKKTKTTAILADAGIKLSAYVTLQQRCCCAAIDRRCLSLFSYCCCFFSFPSSPFVRSLRQHSIYTITQHLFFSTLYLCWRSGCWFTVWLHKPRAFVLIAMDWTASKGFLYALVNRWDTLEAPSSNTVKRYTFYI